MAAIDNNVDRRVRRGPIAPEVVRDEQGQDLLEYALLAGFLSWVCFEWVLSRWS